MTRYTIETMEKVAKVLVVDGNENYLLMTRSDHPTFRFDWDLPGGTMEDGEDPRQTAAREVYEEIGVKVAAEDLVLRRNDTSFSRSDTSYYLYEYRVKSRPAIVLSWEHASYEWVRRDVFIQNSKNAVDTYMHMVADTLLKIEASI